MVRELHTTGKPEYQLRWSGAARSVTDRPIAGSRTLVRTRGLLAKMKNWGILPSSTALGATMLRDRKSGVFFPEVTWHDKPDVSVRHWLRIRPPLRPQDAPPASIRFVTGTCLFGSGGATMTLADGSRYPLVSNRLSLPSPLESFSTCEKLSAYERETAYRLTGVIGGMAVRSAQNTRIYVHIPRPEYVLVMFGHRRGARTGSVMRDWVEAVERRGARLGQLFKMLLARKCDAHVEVGSPLDALLMPYLRGAIAQGRTPSPDELVEVLKSRESAVGELLSHWLATRGDNGAIDYYDLAHFGYVAGLATNLLPSTLTVEVDNPSEEPIFRALSRILRTQGDHSVIWPGNAMAVYPYQALPNSRRASAEWQLVRGSAGSADAVPTNSDERAPRSASDSHDSNVAARIRSLAQLRLCEPVPDSLERLPAASSSS
jgi:hypothetical protein